MCCVDLTVWSLLRFIRCIKLWNVPNANYSGGIRGSWVSAVERELVPYIAMRQFWIPLNRNFLTVKAASNSNGWVSPGLQIHQYLVYLQFYFCWLWKLIFDESFRRGQKHCRSYLLQPGSQLARVPSIVAFQYKYAPACRNKVHEGWLFYYTVKIQSVKGV